MHGSILVLTGRRTTLLASTKTTSNLNVAYDAPEYAASIPGFGVDVVRTGRGHGPNLSRVTTLDNSVIGSAVIYFPMLGIARIPEDTVLINLVTSAPPGSRWCGIDLQPGTVMLYGPGAPHTGITPAGFGFSFVALRVDDTEEAADRLEMKLDLPERGRVRTLDPTPSVRYLKGLLDLMADPLRSAELAEAHDQETIHAAVAALSVERTTHEAGSGSRIDSRHVVHVCIEFASAIERKPTISEMCLVAHVSERRLRSAFTDVFGMPPMRYFRYRSLTQARQCLTEEAVHVTSVGAIASDLGFHNFGRFARRYEAMYGELPSATLRHI